MAQQDRLEKAAYAGRCEGDRIARLSKLANPFPNSPLSAAHNIADEAQLTVLANKAAVHATFNNPHRADEIPVYAGEFVIGFKQSGGRMQVHNDTQPVPAYSQADIEKDIILAKLRNRD